VLGFVDLGISVAWGGSGGAVTALMGLLCFSLPVDFFFARLGIFFFSAFWRKKKSSEFSCASLAPIKKIASPVDALRGALGEKNPTPTYMYRNHLKAPTHLVFVLFVF
jgi:hypothetical protein